MAGMNVEEAQLLQAKQDVENAVEKIRGLINAAQADADGMKAGWRGEAAKAFGIVAMEWKDESDKVNMMLNEIRAAIGDTHTKTTSTEDDNVTMLKIS